MTPDERQLITGLFDRMRGYSLTEKDGEAETLINGQVAGLRDAPYMLVQSVLVQEHALQQADARIKELEDQVRQLQSDTRPPAGGSGSFLGGLFGGGRPAGEPSRGGGTSVPPIGSRAAPSVYESRQPVWGSQGGPQAGPQGGYPGPAQQPGGPFGAQQPAGGGFLRSAVTTAAGVAGGMLVAGAISNMLGGHSANAATPSQAASSQAASSQAAQGAASSDATAAKDDATARDDAYQDGYQDATDDAGDDDDDWGGGDSGDLDI